MEYETNDAETRRCYDATAPGSDAAGSHLYTEASLRGLRARLRCHKPVSALGAVNTAYAYAVPF